MGHKVHPVIYRTPALHLWDSRWFARKDQLAALLEQEVAIRDWLTAKLKDAGLDGISIERSPKEVKLTLLVGKPGVVIGRGGQGIELLRKSIERKMMRFKQRVSLNIQAVEHPQLSAAIVAAQAALDIEKRMPFRRVMKHTIERVMSGGALGVKIKMSGRLNGVEIARREKLAAGKMSLITMRSNVDYAFAEAHTVYGKIGIKVWVYRGESFARSDRFEARAAAPSRRRRAN
ncbi:MAG: 30S ribosomal protein S3 [Candidatus Magasanikbacteria bacterium]|nr:30S ribosomal protein S3 [Candidatus Magasanikbacteria bacterium]